MKEKREKPFKLDMSFGEALNRYGRVNTKEQKMTESNEYRIPERSVAYIALQILCKAQDGFMTTSDLIAALEKHFDPVGEDAEILDNRSDSRFSQKVRNLVSHRDYPSGLSTNGYADYSETKHGWTITAKGRAYAGAVEN